MLILLNANIAKSKLIAERLSARLMIVHSALAMGIYSLGSRPPPFRARFNYA